MSKLTRVTAKVFGATADGTLADPEIGQFGSAKAGTYVGTGDIATIQNLSAWSNGWIDAVTPTQQFPTLPERTGVDKVLSYQNAYVLQQGIPEWDSATDYYTNGFCSKNGKIYFSKTDNNVNHDPETDTVNWEEFTSGGDSRNIGEIVQSTIPLTDAGLHLLDGALIDGNGIYSAFVDYIAELHNSSAKTSNVTKVGSLTDNNGVLSGFGTSNYAQIPITFSPNTKNWDIVFKGKFTTTSTANNIVSGYNNQNIAFYINTSGNLMCSIGNGSSWVINNLTGTTTLLANTDYWYKLTFNGTNYIMYTSTDGETWTQEASSTNSVNINGTTLNIGVPRLLENNYWSGTIDLNESYINIDNKRWWTGMQPSWATDEAQWQTSVTNYGVCGKFVYDSVNNTVRLPKYNSKIYTGGGTAPVVGNGKALGMTNGTNNAGAGGKSAYGIIAYPELYGHNNDITDPTGTQLVGTIGITTDPTNSGVIADLSNITTSVDGYYYIVVATLTKTAIEVDIDEIATDLNGKVDKSSLSEVYPVVETYMSGTSWYRVYSDGWCEQGGYVGTVTETSATINLLKTYKDTNYSVLISTYSSTQNGHTGGATVNQKTVSSFTTGCFEYFSGGLFLIGNWRTSGYIS